MTYHYFLLQQRLKITSPFQTTAPTYVDIEKVLNIYNLRIIFFITLYYFKSGNIRTYIDNIDMG